MRNEDPRFNLRSVVPDVHLPPCQGSGSARLALGVLCFPGGSISFGTVFEWMSRGSPGQWISCPFPRETIRSRISHGGVFAVGTVVGWMRVDLAAQLDYLLI